MSKDGRIWLSHTGVETLERCPRCFWLQYRRGIRQPEGIVSRLSNRFDVVLKNYFNAFRGTSELPQMVAGRMKGRLQDPFQEKYFVRIDAKYGFLGKLDECLVLESGELVPVDFKTTSTDPRGKEVLSAYQSQIDDYIFLIRQNQKPAAGYGHLVFVYPNESRELHLGFPMIVEVVTVQGNPEATAERIAKSIEVLEGPMPNPNPGCSFCAWFEQVKSQIGAALQPSDMSFNAAGDIPMVLQQP